MNKEPLTTREIVCGLASFFLLVVLFPSAEWIRLNAPIWVYKSVAGFLLGTIGTFSYATMISLYVKAKTEGFAAIEETVWVRPFSYVFYALIAIFGILAWVVSWEGNTGLPYGIGVFIGASLMEAGAGSIIKKGK